MTYLWGGMILIGVLYGAFAGNLQAVTEAVVSSSGEAVSLCITMAGITAMSLYFSEFFIKSFWDFLGKHQRRTKSNGGIGPSE